MAYRRFLYLWVPSALIGAGVGLGLGEVLRHSLIPFLTGRTAGVPLLSYDPEQMVSFMFDFEVFIWLSLMGSTPGLDLKRKCLNAFLGITAAFILTVVTVLLIETFHLAPHKGMFKFAVVLLPFAVYYFSFHFGAEGAPPLSGSGTHYARSR